MEEVREIAECSICIDLFTDPRMLPCIHTFCLKCLNETSVKAELKPGDSMPCPLCRTSFDIPKEGISGLKKNFFLERLVQVVKISKPSETQKPCDICAEDSEDGATEIPAATQFCIQCHKNICDRCCREHRRHVKRHQLVPLKSPLKKLSRKRSASQLCDQHTKKELEMFCTNCKQAICMICVSEEHNSHKCLDIERAADQFRTEINEELKRMKSLSLKTSQKCQQIFEEQKKFCDSLVNSEETIIKRGNELKEMIDRCTKSLLDELASIKQQEMKRLESEREESERHKVTVESLISYSNQLISKGSSVEICLNVSDLRLRNENVQKLVFQRIQKEQVSPEIVFQSSELEDFFKRENIVGILKGKSGMVDEEKAAENNECYVPVAVRSTSQVGLVDNPVVRGVTKLMNKIYVLTSEPNRILVSQDSEPFHFQTKIEMREIEHPRNIESSERLKSLFIFDYKFRCIWKMTIDDNRIIKWLSDVDNLFKISPLIDDKLLILRKYASSSQLEICGSDGNLVRSLVLPSDIVDPWCCVQKQSGEFIIGHAYRQPGHWMISQLSSDGQKIIHQITSEKFANYSNLFLDHENSRLFAADFYNRRIVVFDSNSLELKQTLLTEREHEISRPYKLFFDSRRMKLFVSNFGAPTKFLYIYELYTTAVI